uniref:Uncharacterized protein n=1 Tax=Arundo donax TaxID=35708 RepID=A0A0A8YEG4_ARUDO
MERTQWAHLSQHLFAVGGLGASDRGGSRALGQSEHPRRVGLLPGVIT